MKPKLLFLTLNVFSATGGIEKVARLAGKALSELCGGDQDALTVLSAYDRTADVDVRYIPAASFEGFGGARRRFVLSSLKQGRTASVVLLSHINLLPVGYAIKKLVPGTRLVLFAHGIEVWRRLPAWKRHLLHACDRILPVSRFTAQKMCTLYGLKEAKMVVLNNGLDPFLPPLPAERKSEALLRRYGFTTANKVILTLSRLSYRERYKGYDEVIMALKALKRKDPALRYLLVGRFDDQEKARLDRLISQQRLQGEVVFAGFVPTEELALHFALADVYAMPSRKEGFGIVFIEALYYGLPVIAGNVDGSVDALDNGALGALVDPDRPEEIRAALEQSLARGRAGVPARADILARYGFPVYRAALRQALEPFFPFTSPEPGRSKQLSPEPGYPVLQP